MRVLALVYALVVLALLALVYAPRSFSQSGTSMCFQWNYYGTLYTNGSDIASAIQAYETQQNPGTTYSYQASIPGPPTAAGQYDQFTGTATISTGQEPAPSNYATSQSVDCANNSCKAGQTDDLNLGSALSEGSTATGSNGCCYTMGPTSTFEGVMSMTGGVQTTRQSGTQTGQSCSTGSGSPAASVGSQLDSGKPVADCSAGGGDIACVVETAGSLSTYQATFNGDVVVAGQPAAGTCQLYSSGGAACTPSVGQGVVATPPGPDNGTAGTPASPDMTVTNTSTAGGSPQTATGASKTSYYSASKVAASSVGVQGTGSGTSGSKTGSSGSSGTGSTGSSSSCPAGQTCNGTADSNSGGLDCSSPPTCTDTDPNVCGVMNQTWLMRCEGVTDDQVASTIGTVPGIAATSGGDFSSPTSESGAFGGESATCPGPTTFSVLGQTVTLDYWSMLCQFGGYIAGAVMFTAYLFAARLMFAAVAGPPGGSS